MQILIVYYSRTQTTKNAAMALATKLGADIEEIKEVGGRKGIIGYLRSGKEAVMKVQADIHNPKTRPRDYDLVILGTPVWVGTMASPVRSYVDKFKAELPEVAFITTQGSSQTQRVFKDMQELVGKGPVATLKLTTKEVVQEGYEPKLDKFVEKLKRTTHNA